MGKQKNSLKKNELEKGWDGGMSEVRLVLFS